MKQLVDNAYYLDVIAPGVDTVSFTKTSLKRVYVTNGAVFLELIDDVPYFLNFAQIENPATPGIPYTSAVQLYTDLLSYLAVG